MAKKSSKKTSGKIKKDKDGTFYCGKCGKAGFKHSNGVTAHLKHCKGFDKVREEVIKQSLDEDPTSMPHQYRVENYFGEVVEVSPTTSPNSHAGMREPAENMRARRAHAEKPKFVSVELMEARAEADKERAKNAILQKFVFNHQDHMSRQTFSGPSDLLTSGLSDIMNIKWVRYAVGVGALLFVFSWIKESADKLSGRVSNKSTGKKK